jgi:hypothetical protein
VWAGKRPFFEFLILVRVRRYERIGFVAFPSKTLCQRGCAARLYQRAPVAACERMTESGSPPGAARSQPAERRDAHEQVEARVSFSAMKISDAARPERPSAAAGTAGSGVAACLHPRAPACIPVVGGWVV